MFVPFEECNWIESLFFLTVFPLDLEGGVSRDEAALVIHALQEGGDDEEGILVTGIRSKLRGTLYSKG